MFLENYFRCLLHRFNCELVTWGAALFYFEFSKPKISGKFSVLRFVVTGPRTTCGIKNMIQLTAGETGALFSEQTGPALSRKECCCWFRRTNRARVQTAAKHAESCGNHSRVIAVGKGTH
jgi:hypothetical protein